MGYDDEKTPREVPFLFSFIFFLMGLFVFVIAPISIGREMKKNDYPTMTAIVIDQDVVVFEKDGKQYFLSVSTGEYNFGSKVQVRYNPDDINDAVIGNNSLFGMIFGMVFSMITGGAFMAVGWWLMFPDFFKKLFKKKKKEESTFGKVEN